MQCVRFTRWRLPDLLFSGNHMYKYGHARLQKAALGLFLAIRNESSDEFA